MVPIGHRKYPLKRPDGHKVPVPRWMLKLPNEVSQIYTLYVGVQKVGPDAAAVSATEEIIRVWLEKDNGRPAAVDVFRVTHGYDVVESRVWVAYWTSAEDFNSKLERLDLRKIWYDLGCSRSSVGLWTEHFKTPVDRLETNYARLDHKPGLAQLPGIEQPEHDLTAYWGAGRDRIPASATDRFEHPHNAVFSERTAKGINERVFGCNYDNMCHIRSGQWWVKCNGIERAAYEEKLQKTLMTGMQYLWDHPEETGTIGLRFLQNLDKDTFEPIRETCGAGFHRNWADLEKWSSRHPSHLAIFNGAMKHAKEFGDDRKFMTWHEVSILKAGEARFDYINCDPKTGVIRWVPLQVEDLDTQ